MYICIYNIYIIYVYIYMILKYLHYKKHTLLLLECPAIGV